MPVARLISLQNISYAEQPLASGATKDVYLTTDGQSVIALYRDPAVRDDPVYVARLKAIVARHNVTLSRSEGGAARNTEEAARLKALFNWPTAVTVAPKLGYVAPVFPDRYWFRADPRNLPIKDPDSGRFDKKAKWFTERRIWTKLHRRERGDLRSLLQVCILLAHATGRLHLMGLAHSDLSSNNVLVDPLPSSESSGWPGCLILDLDTVVVPGFYPAAVLGTTGYIDPTVLATSGPGLPATQRRMPDRTSDRHAMAVLIYELLLHSHPLLGPKLRSAESEEEDDFLALGRDALFIEHPTDQSNRPKSIRISYGQLGRPISALFERAFIQGLHDPEARPLAAEWERALWETLDLLYPCTNSTCLWRWFPCEHGSSSSCPAGCGSRAQHPLPVLHLTSRDVRPNKGTGRLVCWPGQRLHRWHADESYLPLPLENEAPVAEIAKDPQGNQWFIRNLRLQGMKLMAANQKVIPIGGQHPLLPGVKILLGDQSRSRVAQFIVE